jgi:hypothetical protein
MHQEKGKSQGRPTVAATRTTSSPIATLREEKITVEDLFARTSQNFSPRATSSIVLFGETSTIYTSWLFSG